jgi:hypothetical protein
MALKFHPILKSRTCLRGERPAFNGTAGTPGMWRRPDRP